MLMRKRAIDLKRACDQAFLPAPFGYLCAPLSGDVLSYGKAL